jgi:hypothetical protein
MRLVQPYGAPERWALTMQGVDAIVRDEVPCACDRLEVVNTFFVCLSCETAYGMVAPMQVWRGKERYRRTTP